MRDFFSRIGRLGLIEAQHGFLFPTRYKLNKGQTNGGMDVFEERFQWDA